jgi:hypothetical protein
VSLIQQQEPEKLEDRVVETLINFVDEVRDRIQIRKVNILEAIDVFKKHSLLGQINKPQFINAVNELYDKMLEDDILTVQDLDRSDQIMFLMSILGMDNHCSELFELSDILSSLIPIFEGREEEKIQAFKLIYDYSDDQEISLEELNQIILNMFSFILKRIPNIDKDIPCKLTESIYDDYLQHFEVQNNLKHLVNEGKIVEFFNKF